MSTPQPKPRVIKSSSDPQQYLKIIWSNIIQRTENPKHESYPFYGAKGIKLWPAWRQDFQCFKRDILKLIGERPPGLRPNGLSLWELDRISSYKNYEPGNLRWLENWKNQANKRQRQQASTQKLIRRRTSKRLSTYETETGLPYYIYNCNGILIMNNESFHRS
jgi:hypothetical protein